MFITYNFFDLESGDTSSGTAEFRAISYDFSKKVASISFSNNSEIYLYFSTEDEYKFFHKGIYRLLVTDIKTIFLKGLCFRDLENVEACINEINLNFGKEYFDYKVKDSKYESVDSFMDLRKEPKEINHSKFEDVQFRINFKHKPLPDDYFELINDEYLFEE